MLFNLSKTFNIWPSLTGPMNFLLCLHRQDTLCHQQYVWSFPPTSSIKCLSHVPKGSFLNYVKAFLSGFDKPICSNTSKFFAAKIIFLAQEFMLSFFLTPWSPLRERSHWCGSPEWSVLTVCISTLWNKHYCVASHRAREKQL